MRQIYDYTDYRKFLAERYLELKARDRKFSHRYISKQVGFGSAGFFADVLAGRRNLAGPPLLKLASLLDLGKEDEEYFINLVMYNQSGSIDEKNRYYEKLMGVSRVDVRVLQADKFEYFSTWYCPAIRELLSFYPYRGDYRALAKKLDPPITPEEAAKAIELLGKLDLIRREADGRYAVTETSVSTGEGFASLMVANFQRSFMDLARESLDRHATEERDFSTLSLPFAKEDLERARIAIARMRKYLLAMSDKCRKPERVYQFNFQAFPLTEA
jgi:uncharacterized protein (TIGR02147 family)